MAESKSKGKLSSEQIEQKLVLFNSSQESVQGMSLWIMHNKAHHRKIVDTWLKVLRKSDSKHKLTLFYLCNDVVQHAKKKKALYYLENFKDNLREAVTIVREFDSIKPNIERIFKIWDERRTYDAKFIKELRGIMEGGSSSKSSSASGTPAHASPVVYKPSSKPSSKDKRKEKSRKEKKEAEKDADRKVKDIKAMDVTPDISGEFKPSTFISQITTLKKLEGDVTLKAKQLAALRIDATSIEAVKQLKDRSHGNEFCRQFEESCVKIEDYVGMLEKEISQRQQVLSMCENAEDFYCTLFDEAKVVANAYKNFGARVTNMKKRVDDMKKIIPATPSPVPSPTADAPSPGNSPPLLNMDDNEMVDMDLCNEDSEQPKQDPVPIMPGRAYTAMVKSIGQPIASLTNIVMGQKDQSSEEDGIDVGDTGMMATGTFQGTNILESRIANMLPNLAKGASGMNTMGPPGMGDKTGDLFKPGKDASQVPDVYTPPPRLDQPPPPQPVPPVAARTPPEPEGDDGGSSTPVMDEPDDKEESPPPKPAPVSKPSEGKTKTNPIDFLSQLLTKTSSSSSSSNFLQTLSLLTNTVKTQYQKKQDEESEGGKQEDEPKPPSPTYAPGLNNQAKSAETEFMGVPPVPNSQSNSWTGWKSHNASQSDPSSPPLISQPKPLEVPHHPPPPLPQHPPPPPESVPNPPFNIQPPSPQDFSLPPPSMRQNVSQSFINPPPPIPPPSDSQFNPRASSASFQQVTNAQAGQPVLSSSVAPTNMVRPPGPGFVSNVRFSIAQVPSDTVQIIPATGFPQPPAQRPPPPVSGFAPPQSPVRPPLPSQQPPPRSGFLPGQSPIQGPPPGPGFVQGRENPFIRGPFAPPPPPPNSAAPPNPWQAEGMRAENQPFSNQISPVSSQRPVWNSTGNNWDQDQGERENQSDSGYAHPWDQPQNYDEDDDENDYVDEILETALPPAPKKSILRNNRKSSLREVTLVEETEDTEDVSRAETSVNYTPVIPQVREHKPVGILKRPSEVKPVIGSSDNAQSEFINILKQKSGPKSEFPDAPPTSRTFSHPGEHIPSGHSLENMSANNRGEQISTISVLGHSGRSSSVHSDDMDLDNDESDYDGNRDNGRHWGQDTWADNANVEKPDIHRAASDVHGDFNNRLSDIDRQHSFERHSDFERSHDYERRDFTGPPPRQQGWSEPRSWQPRPRGPPDHGGFQPRGGYQPRPRFQDNFRGPSPAKRPFFSPRDRLPYQRY